MVRTAFVSACFVASALAWSPEFMQGIETGIFLSDETHFKDYSCAMPMLDPQAKVMIDMITPFKAMAENMNQGKHVAILDTLSDMTKQIAILYSLFQTEYDGGDFCMGLILSKEVATILLAFGKNIFAGLFGGFGENHVDTHESVEKMLGPQ